MELRKTTVKTAHGGNRLWKLMNSMGPSAFAFLLHLLQCWEEILGAIISVCPLIVSGPGTALLLITLPD